MDIETHSDSGDEPLAQRNHLEGPGTLESEPESEAAPEPEHLTTKNGAPDECCWLSGDPSLELVATDSGDSIAKSITVEEASTKIYHPLESWQTRIICLEPGTYGQPISVRVLPVDIIYAEGVVITETRTRVQYDAVSYSWGHPALTCSIKCNGEDLPINPVVFQALQRLRLADQRRYLWIDAISINQSDLKEKSVQIKLMFSIFKKAATVLIWLGEAENISEILAVRILQTRYPNGEQTRISALELFPDCPGCVLEAYKGFTSILSRPWRSRTWVRQEVFAARKLLVQIGYRSLSWQALTKIPDQAALAAATLRNQNFQTKLLKLAWNEKLRQVSPQELGLLDSGDYERDYATKDVNFDAEYGPWNLLDTCNAKCDLFLTLLANSEFCASDPRDFVYGVLGMTNAAIVDGAANQMQELSALRIDYTLSVSDVFQRAAKYIIERDRSLDVVLLSAWGSRPNDSLILPSWTPDWRRPYIEERVHSGTFNFLNNFQPELSKPTQYRTDKEGILSLRGFTCGILQRISERILFLPGDHHSQFRASMRPVRKILQLKTIAGLSDPYERKPSRTESSVFIPEDIETGDKIVALEGSRMLVVLRSAHSGQHEFIGPALARLSGLEHLLPGLVYEELWALQYELSPDVKVLYCSENFDLV